MNLKKNFIYFLHLYKSILNSRDTNTFVFGSWFGDKFADNSKFLYLYTLNLGMNSTWITKNIEIYNQLKSEGKPVALMGTEESKRICSQAKYAVVSTGKYDVEADCIGGATILNVWHGIPLKKIGYDDHVTADSISIHKKIWNYLNDNATKNTYYFSTSPVISQIYQSCFKTDKEHIIQIGQARNDVFFDGTFKRVKLGNKKYKYAITYMPTHRNEGKTKLDLYAHFDFDKLNSYCVKNDILFVIKKHYYNRNDDDPITKYSNILDLTNEDCDTQELLFNSDILITDYSSCYIDYLLLDRPILFYCFDYEEYLEKDREMYFTYDDVTPGAKVRSFDELLGAIDLAINGNVEFQDKLKKVKDLFYSPENQGRVCPSIVEEIKKL